MMKRLWNLIIKGRGENDVYDAASACNTLTSEAIVATLTTIAMIEMKRSKGQYNCKSIKGLKNMAQRKYEYDQVSSLCARVILHPRLTYCQVVFTITGKKQGVGNWLVREISRREILRNFEDHINFK